MYIINALLVLFLIESFHCQVTVLDRRFNPLLRLTRESLNVIVNPLTFEQGYQINLINGKTQTPYSKSEPFFCDVKGPGARSAEVPKSVHKLTPGDIDIVAAIGDSLTAGNGILAMNIWQILVEGRGMSFAIGGQDDWRRFLTIPNIIKEFNPNLYGYSQSNGLSYQKSSVFNVAEPGAQSRDIPHQAKNLVKRMRNDNKVDLNNHWKLVTVVIGGNDFCLDICYYDNQDDAVDMHEKHLVEVLRTIRDNLPRTMVSVGLPPDVEILLNLRGKSEICQFLHYWECPCMFSLNKRLVRRRSFLTIKRWKERIVEVVNREEFHRRDDFTVSVQIFTNRTDIPKTEEGFSDFSFLSTDCFHLSQKGNSHVARALWNNMLEPVGNKTDSWDISNTRFLCPTIENPYLTTRLNSLQANKL